jgi:hypothetical protein
LGEGLGEGDMRYHGMAHPSALWQGEKFVHGAQ